MGSLYALPRCHPHDAPWVEQRFAKFPQRFRPHLARRYERVYRSDTEFPRREANTLLRNLTDTPQHGYRLAADNDELVDFDAAKAKACARLAAPLKGAEERYRVLAKFVRDHGLQPPDPIGPITIEGAVARMTDELWWRRAVRCSHGRATEKVARDLMLVNKDTGIYSSDETLYRRRGQKRRNRQMLDELLATNEQGDSYTVAELADLSTSNPAIRRNELMTRIAGFEAVAKQLGHVGEFITLTCPSRMHKAKLAGGNGKAIENPKFDGTTPREAQAYLSRVWSRIRSKLARHGIKLYGFRVAEPNHDGCPHWHFLVFLPAWARRRVRQTFLHYGLAEDGDEPGAKGRRVTFVTIDNNKGSATGYVAKYIAKNIDGFGIEGDQYGNDAVSAAERVDAWAACWGIRQFQQLGGPPVTVWRELRRIEYECDDILEAARDCADKGDWAGFIRIMGGPTAPRETQPIRAAYWHEIDRETGELPQNRYGELATERLFGLRIGETLQMTRWHTWRIEKAKKAPPPACTTETADQRAQGLSNPKTDAYPAQPPAPEPVIFHGGNEPAPPWSSVNNCTQRYDCDSITESIC